MIARCRKGTDSVFYSGGGGVVPDPIPEIDVKICFDLNFRLKLNSLMFSHNDFEEERRIEFKLM